MKKVALPLLAALVLAGCQHPDGRAQAQATQAGIATAASATVQNDRAVAAAQQRLDAADAAAARIDHDVQDLLNSH